MNVLIEKLVKYDIVNYLSGLNIKQDNNLEQFSGEEILQLCKYASLLALSDKDDEQMLSYEISTKLFINFYEKYPTLYSIVFSILSRLGNFPNRDLLKKYKPSEEFRSQSLLIDLERMAREKENQLILQNNEQIFLTDFQKRFFDVLTDRHFFSVSAPTSAGKSFIFTLAIVKRLLKNPNEVIVLIVPTRALIKELSEKIIKKLKHYNLFEKVDVRILPILEDKSNDKGRVYVLTQERLSTLLEENIKINTCFIDEAQEIQNNRGVVLQNTIELLIKRNHDINLFFASPLIKNPEYFNKLFEQKFDNEYFIENISPVGQNILLLSEIKNKPKSVFIENIDFNSQRKNLGEFKLDFKFRKNEKIISLAKQICREDELTLIYCNDPGEAEKRALLLTEKINNIDTDDEIIGLINFIKEDIHKDYSIIQCLKKGIAYHYGYMPSSIRAEIERLANIGKLRFVFCTSTLLQGVNLPAKNIIISRPNKGKNQPMNRADFLNLIGRAGRLLYEFQGNIWCIEPNQWELKSFEGNKLQEIGAYFETSLLTKTDEIIEIAKDQNNDSNEVAVFGKFYLDFIINEQNIDQFKEHISYEKIQNLFDISKLIAHQLPDNIIRKHYSIHPARLQKMYVYFKENSSNDLNEFIPKKAYQKHTNDNLKLIFKLIDLILFNKGNENKQYELFSFIASSWMHDKPISQIILERNKYTKENINSTIREVLEIIEKQIRYKYVIATHAYLDILKLALLERGKDFNVDLIPNLPLYLECGTSDKTILSLISLGLSRLTSIKLKMSKKFRCDEPTVTNCFYALQKIDIKNLNIPEVCKHEIMGLIL
ncbi:DEAD/DEAH box helicase [Campylobacter rectus RM3267]|uniref:DEAD box helicase domain-containing protein n=2 Tax=Campylobacter rectus TaxID=203 RepID=A0A6G5QLL4_CAMRE|nr:DEAD/DEAH box helicase [Campylobacter rectus]EEF14136.1 DEAD/DEAH box helicase [Campylobacter rectus RM3267]QCD46623.1 DEAD box helicase domain-containing protein [Campylobacter rectus]UEB47323.1 DEAD/DEAH box helicase [Campylobacter rectus]